MLLQTYPQIFKNAVNSVDETPKGRNRENEDYKMWIRKPIKAEIREDKKKAG